MSEFNFDLTTEPCVPVVVGGRRSLMSLAATLIGAHEIDDLDWGEPLAAPAILSLLCAITRDAFGVTDIRRVGELWDSGRLDRDLVSDYLRRYRHRFNLFDERFPFFQSGGLAASSGGHKPVSLLVLRQATGNNVPLFSSATESSVPPLHPAEAFHHLIAIHAYDTAAIKTGAQGDPRVSAGKTTGNPTGPLGQLGLVTLVGRSLLHTLLLNCPLGGASADDNPPWRQEDDASGPTWSERMPRGPVDLLTWQSRRVRLLPEIVDGETLVTGVLVCAGDRLRALDPRLEKRTAFRRPERPRPNEPAIRPKRHRPGVSAWRGLHALVSGSEAGGDRDLVPGVIQQVAQLVRSGFLDDSYAVDVQLTGVEYGNQSAVIENVFTDRTPLPLRAVDDETGVEVRAVLEHLAVQTSQVIRALDELEANLRKSSGGEPLPWDKGQRAGDRLLVALEAPAQRILIGLTRDPGHANVAHEVWERVLRRSAAPIATSLVEAVPPTAFLGHREGGERVMREQLAEVFYRSALNRALPATAPPLMQDRRSGQGLQPLHDKESL